MGQPAEPPAPGALDAEAAAGFNRYLNNSTNPEIRAALADQVATLRSALPVELQDKGNLSYAQVDVQGLPDSMKAFSRFDAGEFGFQPRPDNPILTEALSINKYGIVDGPAAYSRAQDGEYKILESIAQKIGDNSSATGQIDLFSELKVCFSCTAEVLAFREKYPQIQLNVFTGK
jgi:filamentous hemagglutinin